MKDFNPYEFLNRLNADEDEGGERLMLSDQFKATDLGTMLKTALIAVELLSERVRELEKMSGRISIPDPVAFEQWRVR